MGKLTISMVIFNSKLLVITRGYPDGWWIFQPQPPPPTFTATAIVFSSVSQWIDLGEPEKIEKYDSGWWFGT